MDKKEFAQFLVSHGVVGFKPEGITLKSGKTSYWYVNCRVLSQSFAALAKTADYVAAFLAENDLQSAQIVGVPEGATLLGLEVQRKMIANGQLDDVILSPRVKAKDHGDPANRFWTNGNIPEKVLLLEDVTTTGGSAIEAAEKFREMGIEVVGIVGLVNRMQKSADDVSVEGNMKHHDLTYVSLVDANDVLPVALEALDASERDDVAKLVRGEYAEEYAGENNPIKL